MSAKGEVRLGIVGCGGISHAHAGAAQATGGKVRFAACCDVAEDRAREWAARYGCGAAHTDYLEMIRREKLDVYGLSAIPGAGRIGEMSLEECARFGERARSLGMVVGETGMWANLMTPNKELLAQRIEAARTLLPKAEAMGCRCFVSLVGTRAASDHPLEPHPYMHTKECRREFRDTVLRILDGLDLKSTTYGIEPWHNTFFYQPEDIREFIDSVGHPRFGLHLDQMNMVSQRNYHDTTGLINRTFDLLADAVASVHLKDIRCDPGHMFLKWDEVNIGDGVMDYETFLKRLAELPPDTTCYCEHMREERDYALNFARLHRLAERAGVRFLPRMPR